MSTERIADTCVILGIILIITLKICNIITWSWWVILAPIWISFVIGIFFAIFVIIVLIIEHMKES